MAEGQKLLSVPAAAKELKVSEQRVRQLLRDNKLKGDQPGRDWVVDAQSVADRKAKLAAASTQEPAAAS